MNPTDVLHNARVSRPTGHAPIEGDLPSLDASLERFPAPLEHVPSDDALPLPNAIDGSGIDQLLGNSSRHRPLAEGIAHSIEDFSRLIDAGLVEVPS